MLNQNVHHEDFADTQAWKCKVEVPQCYEGVGSVDCGVKKEKQNHNRKFSPSG